MSTGSVAPFALAGAVTIAGSTVSASALLPAVGDVLVITNLAAAVAYVALGQAAAIGGSGSIVVPPGQRRVLASNAYIGSAAAILVSGTGSVVIEVGTGTVFG